MTDTVTEPEFVQFETLTLPDNAKGVGHLLWEIRTDQDLAPAQNTSSFSVAYHLAIEAGRVQYDHATWSQLHTLLNNALQLKATIAGDAIYFTYKDTHYEIRWVRPAATVDPADDIDENPES